MSTSDNGPIRTVGVLGAPDSAAVAHYHTAALTHSLAVDSLSTDDSRSALLAALNQIDLLVVADPRADLETIARMAVHLRVDFLSDRPYTLDPESMFDLSRQAARTSLVGGLPARTALRAVVPDSLAGPRSILGVRHVAATDGGWTWADTLLGWEGVDRLAQALDHVGDVRSGVLAVSFTPDGDAATVSMAFDNRSWLRLKTHHTSDAPSDELTIEAGTTRVELFDLAARTGRRGRLTRPGRADEDLVVPDVATCRATLLGDVLQAAATGDRSGQRRDERLVLTVAALRDVLLGDDDTAVVRF